MKIIAAAVFCLVSFPSFVYVHADAEVPMPEIMSATLSDGSHLTVSLKAQPLILRTAYGRLALPAAMVRSVTFPEKKGAARVTLSNEDRLTGRIDGKQLAVATVLGDLSLPWEHIVSIDAHPEKPLPDVISYRPTLQRPCNFEIFLHDSSCVIGTPDHTQAALYAVCGKLPLPWQWVRRVAFQPDKETCAITLWNGDLLKGCVDWRAFAVATGMGPIHVNTAHTREIEVTLGGMDLVKKPYAAASGNRHFMGALKNDKPKRIGGRLVPPDQFIEAHASGRIEYHFDRPIQEFHAILTMYESYCAHKGNVIFSVETDAGRIYKSPALRNLHRRPVYLKFKPTKKLVLVTYQNGSTHEDWSVWLRPEVR